MGCMYVLCKHAEVNVPKHTSMYVHKHIFTENGNRGVLESLFLGVLQKVQIWHLGIWFSAGLVAGLHESRSFPA